MRLFISLSYNGSPFCGWQAQPEGRSIQGELERALSLAFGEAVEVVGAGRTDAGVNARNYIAHFDLTAEAVKEPKQSVRKINAILPREIRVFDIFLVSPDAHARYDALSRTYKYFLHTEKDPFAHFSYLYTFPLDMEAMNRAATRLLGAHDFASFEKTGSDNGTSLCTVTEARWERLDESHLVFTVTANRFLRNMVRAMVGTLLEIGRGKKDEAWIDDVLSARDRCSAGQSVPGEALFLDAITYPYPLKSLTIL
jgi:tRNA pseudouridine38-40 synthase